MIYFVKGEVGAEHCYAPTIWDSKGRMRSFFYVIFIPRFKLHRSFEHRYTGNFQ